MIFTQKTLNLTPLHANSIYNVSLTENVTQTLFFDYHDPQSYYHRISHQPKQHQIEIQNLWSNLQRFLDKEIVRVNQQPTSQNITYVNYDHHGIQEMPYVYWIIRWRGSSFKGGKNTIESISDIEKALYDFEILWIFPEKSEIIKVETPLEYEIIGPHLALWGRKGETVGGKEVITFKLKT